MSTRFWRVDVDASIGTASTLLDVHYSENPNCVHPMSQNLTYTDLLGTPHSVCPRALHTRLWDSGMTKYTL